MAGGYDFVGDDYTGENAPVPDNDPLDKLVSSELLFLIHMLINSKL